MPQLFRLPVTSGLLKSFWHIAQECRTRDSDTKRRGRRFTYYVSHRLISGGTDPTGWRLPAEALEAAVRQIIVAHLRRAAAGHDLLVTPDASNAANINMRAAALAEKVEADPAFLGSIITTGTLEHGRLHLHLVDATIASALAVPMEAVAAALLSLSEPFALRRRGVETRIIAGETLPAPDPVLQRTLAEAHGWAKALRAGKPLSEIACEAGRSEPYIRTRIPLAFLAPKVQAAILDGRQPPELSLADLIRDGVPADWDAQLRRFRLG